MSSDGLTLLIGVGSCNGEPSAEVDQGADAIMIAVESFIPPGDDQDGCADEVIVSLDEPLGERRIVDEVTGAELRPVRVMPELPEVDSDDYFDFRPVKERRIDFDGPVSEADARAWAERSGFRIVAMSGDRIETAYTHERVVLIQNTDGNIVAAEVG